MDNTHTGNKDINNHNCIFVPNSYERTPEKYFGFKQNLNLTPLKYHSIALPPGFSFEAGRFIRSLFIPCPVL